MDQGRDAVYVREIIERKQLILKGPETTIPGIFAGPGWYYFLGLGFLFSFGHPVGGIIMLAILNVLLTVILFLFIYKYISKLYSWFGAVGLQIFWPFYDTSRFAFNPFPTVFLAVVLIVLLVLFVQRKHKKYYYLSLVPVLLAFNADLASAAAIYLFFVCVGLYLFLKRKINLKNYLLTTFTLPGIACLFVAKQAFSIFKNPQQLENTRGIFSGTNFFKMVAQFGKIIADSTIPQSLLISALILAVVIYLYIRQKNKNQYAYLFASLTGLIFVVSLAFFSTNKGWRDWHTVYLPTLIFVSTTILLSQLKKQIGIVVFTIIIVCQTAIFIPRYIQYLAPNNNPGVLSSQMKVLDWIYTKNEENGFNVYTYMTNSYFNYPYDYLFWWYGKAKYGHIPCHYEVYPKSHKYIYIPGGEFNYNTPTLGCDKLLFLIKEPIVDQDRFDKWSKNFEDTKLIESIILDQITIEKRQYLR
ncbi:MAG: hypothetical protein AAB546_00745 [Patescibacteria group bacterium]